MGVLEKFINEINGIIHTQFSKIIKIESVMEME